MMSSIWRHNRPTTKGVCEAVLKREHCSDVSTTYLKKDKNTLSFNHYSGSMSDET